jgi:hypothetical protein
MKKKINALLTAIINVVPVNTKKLLTALFCTTLTCCAINSNAQNTRLGTGALPSNSGSNNTAIGYFSINHNTTGSSNTAIGSYSLTNNTTGVYNTSSGHNSLYSNTTGTRNTASGWSTLYFNTTGSYNTASGLNSLHENTTGSYNTANGAYGLFWNTTGEFNTASGHSSLDHNTSGSYNTANGAYSLQSNTTGNFNTASGGYSLQSNTTGYSNTSNGHQSLFSNISGNSNTATGLNALYSNKYGSYNTASGLNSLMYNTGSYNTASGHQSLQSNTTGSSNTASGSYSLFSNTTGNSNTALGYSADVSIGNLTNATAIGSNAKVDASNKVRIGNTVINSIGGQVGWSTFSDGRYKKDIKENVPGLTFINSLRPITYTVNVKGLNEYYNKARKEASGNQVADNENAVINTEMKKAEETAGKIVYTGFVAQEVEEIAKKLNFEFSGVDKPQIKDGLYGLRYDNFIVPLVKAVQELSRQNEDLQKQINELKAVKTASSNTDVSSLSSAKIAITDASLEQNMPNPFSQTTTIGYTLPAKFNKAQIVVTDKNGKMLKQVNISGSGKGNLHIDAATLSSGAYNYSLIIDGRVISAKQMILSQ